MVSSAVRGFDVEDSASVVLRFEAGALGSITLSDAVPAPWSWELASGENPAYPRQYENCYFFGGTRGSLALPRMELWSYQAQKGWHAPLDKEVLSLAAEDPQVRQLHHFCRVIRGEEEPRIGGEDALRTLAATLAVRQAALSGLPVRPDPAGRTA
jgi:predicted dehydrogenase